MYATILIILTSKFVDMSCLSCYTGARGKRKGFSPAAAARPLDWTRAREDSVKKKECHGGNNLNRGVSWRSGGP